MARGDSKTEGQGLNIPECQRETLEHIQNVRNLLNIIIKGLLNRGADHDQSKLHPPEVAQFAEHNDKLHGLTFGSPEYDANKVLLKTALDHHYAVNRHHPQHFPNGINGMNILDLVEMFCDWKAGTMRHANGNLQFSIAKNVADYQMSDQLKQVFLNSIELVE
jgi:Family of unknown function (DUF5662)